MAQFRTLTARVRSADISRENRDLTVRDLVQLGYSAEMATRILSLLSDTQQLEYYLAKGRRSGCVPVTRAGERYPIAVRKRLGEDSPGCLWAKGDLSLLDTPCISLVGSRDLRPENLRFAQTVGLQAAKQGYTLVSGNARGADKTAQEACLAAGGSVICIVADQLERHNARDRVLYLSEDAFDEAFSAQRALSRNRVIHCLGAVTLVAQTSDHKGGTWSGTVQNLYRCWSKVCCFHDGSQATEELLQQGAVAVDLEDLEDLNALLTGSSSLFD